MWLIKLIDLKFVFCLFWFFFLVVQNRSPSKNVNGRDNTESIDMEMSDEDFDTVPDFQSNWRFKFVNLYILIRIFRRYFR